MDNLARVENYTMAQTNKSPSPPLRIVASNSVFGNLGPIGEMMKDRESAPIWERVASKILPFTVESVRERLREFLNDNTPSLTGAEFKSYLKRKGLRIEEEVRLGGSNIQIVENETGRKMSAARVGSKKLSKENITNTMQANTPAIKAAKSQASVASYYRERLNPNIRDALEKKKGRVAIDWSSLEWDIHQALGENHCYAVSGGQGWIGIKIGECLSTADATRMFLADRSAELSQKYKREILFTYDENMEPGSPILIKDRNLVSAASIHNVFKLENIERSFLRESSNDIARAERAMQDAKTDSQRTNLERVIVDAKKVRRTSSFFARFRESVNKQALSAGISHKQTNIIDIQMFRDKFAIKPADRVENKAKLETDGFGLNQRPDGLSEFQKSDAYKSQIIVKYDDHSNPEIWHLGENKRLNMFTSLQSLQPGVYKKEDSANMPAGHIRIDDVGNVTHFDMKMREHNLEGASYEPAIDTDKKRWAIEGKQMSLHEFHEYNDSAQEVQDQAKVNVVRARMAQDADNIPDPNAFGM